MATGDPQGEELPKWLGWLAWGTAGLAVFAFLLGRVTLDALDAELPYRDDVRENASAGPLVAVEVGEGAKDSAEIRDALSVLPEMLTLLAKQKGARLIITDLEAIAARGIEAGDPVSHVAGYFTRDNWELYVAHDAPRPGMVALHEVGHFVDAALDDCSETAEFSALFQQAVESEKLGQHSLSSAAELFAHVFSQHFFSDRRRARLRSEDPEAATFMDTLSSTGACPGLDGLE